MMGGLLDSTVGSLGDDRAAETTPEASDHGPGGDRAPGGTVAILADHHPKDKPLCACGHKALAKGLCSTCYSRVRNHAIKQGSWVGQTGASGFVVSAKARAALLVLRLFRGREGYWPSGALLLELAEPGEHRRNLAAGLNELRDAGVIAYQLVPVGLVRRQTVSQVRQK